MASVSVVMPAYNAERTIAQSVESVLKQTHQDLELIVIDDGSTDGTVDLLSRFDDKRLKVFSFENSGSSKARNRGIAKTTGDYISFIDADDWWTADKLALQLEALEANPAAGVAYSWTSFIDDAGTFLFSQNPILHAGDVFPQMLVRNFLCSGSNILVRRAVIEAVGDFDTTLKAVMDWDYYLRLAAHCHFIPVQKHQVFYRKSPNSVSSNLAKVEIYSLKVIDRAFASAPQNLQHLKRKTLGGLYFYWAKQSIGYECRPENISFAIQRMAKAIQANPKLLLQSKIQKFLLKLFLFKTLSKEKAYALVKSLSENETPNSYQKKVVRSKVKTI